MTTTSFSYPSCSVCWFPTYTSASSFIPHGQAVKSSVASLVRMQAFCKQSGVDILTSQGERRSWMACLVPTLYVSRLIRIPAILRHPAYEYVDMKLLRAVSMYKATSPLSCTHPSESTQIVSRVNCELSSSPLFPLPHEYSSHFSALAQVFSQSCRPSSSSTPGKRSSSDATNWTSSRVSFRNCARSPNCYTTIPSG